MQQLKVFTPTGFVIHVTGVPGAGKTTLIGDMLFNELNNGPCAFLYTRREGNLTSGCWTVLPQEVLHHPNFEAIFLETYSDIVELTKRWRKEPRQAIGIDTSTGYELLIKTALTGDETNDLKTSLGDNQFKKFDNMLCECLQDLREISKFAMMVSPAVPTAYNIEIGQYDKGVSKTSIDADKRFEPDGETQKAKLKLLYQCDYAFHIRREEVKSTGKIGRYELVMEPNMKLSTKVRIPLGRKPLTNIQLSDTVGGNWPKIKESIFGSLT